LSSNVDVSNGFLSISASWSEVDTENTAQIRDY
jgi:hypothetical protein